MKIKEITLDLANNMDWIVRQIAPNAIRTFDRFHVQFSLMLFKQSEYTIGGKLLSKKTKLLQREKNLSVELLQRN